MPDEYRVTLEKLATAVGELPDSGSAPTEAGRYVCTLALCERLERIAENQQRIETALGSLDSLVDAVNGIAFPGEAADAD